MDDSIVEVFDESSLFSPDNCVGSVGSVVKLGSVSLHQPGPREGIRASFDGLWNPDMVFKNLARRAPNQFVLLICEPKQAWTGYPTRRKLYIEGGGSSREVQGAACESK